MFIYWRCWYSSPTAQRGFEAALRNVFTLTWKKKTTHDFWSCKGLYMNLALSPPCCGSLDKSFHLSEPQFLCLYNGFMLPSSPSPHSYVRPAQRRGPNHARVLFCFCFHASFFFLPSLLPSCLPLLGSLPEPPVPSHSFFCASGNNTLQNIFHHYLKVWEWFAPVVSVSMSALEALSPFSSIRYGPRLL